MTACFWKATSSVSTNYDIRLGSPSYPPTLPGLIKRQVLLAGMLELYLHLFAVNLGTSARCLEIVHSISTIRHSARLFGTIAPYSA